MITIKEHIQSEIVEKKSKFIANIFFVESVEEAENKIKEMKKKYYDARHNCSSYRVLEEGKIVEKSSDDGEPSGTAGGPMLNILQKRDLVNVVVIVTRYFGGILLGTGGLVRAYSDVTQNAIEEAEKVVIILGKEFEVKVDYSNLEKLKYYARTNSINISKVEYGNEITCIIQISKENINKFLEDIEKKNLNIIKYKEIGEKYIIN
ncbi:MAG: YigZ family protein [Clostridia bacterium]|nr:YigZ family protein [Clostridia bacterium]